MGQLMQFVIQEHMLEANADRFIKTNKQTSKR